MAQLTLNYQQVPVARALTLLAEQSGMNIVISGTVTGSVSLQLHDVTKEDAIAALVYSQGLTMEKVDGIFVVSQRKTTTAHQPSDLTQRLFRLHHVPVAHIMSSLQSAQQPLLSVHSRLLAETKSNTLLVEDTTRHLARLKTWLDTIDVARPQIAIAARIVMVHESLSQHLGIQWGTQAGWRIGHYHPVHHGNAHLAVTLPTDALPSTANLALSVTKAADRILALELNAAELEDKATIIASPRLMTVDGVTATIKQGKEVPYFTQNKQGNATLAFREAALELSVRPHVTSNQWIELNIKLKQDVTHATSVSPSQQPVIETKDICATVLVPNGHTIVLGGIYESHRDKVSTRVPLLAKLPLAGRLFRRHTAQSSRQELLIFVTPQQVS